ncbi:762_t:CDS:2 [Diversispora eburnea]|uniref:762_t:CDS:1 n=1 Tax=Diversispora eburnea TaxID=1213867 RepID=A0A9N8V2H8_9GLOM|nr:762_t:CDS:2 [Diversispora eburnea]
MDSFEAFPNSNNEISAICSQLEKDKIEIGKQYCCSVEGRNCTLHTYGSGCVGSDFEIAQCHNITTYDPCLKRTDYNATQACGAKSRIITVCDNGINLSPYNETSLPDNTIAYATCGDIFQNTYNCSWTNKTSKVDTERNPLGEICEKLPVTNIITTQTVITSDYGLTTLIITTVIFGIMATTFAVLYFKKYKSVDMIDNLIVLVKLEDGKRDLVPICNYNFILVGGIMRSIVLLVYKETGGGVLFITSSGAIRIIIPISQEQFDKLKKLQDAYQKVVN